jgi:hypothetical protein
MFNVRKKPKATFRVVQNIMTTINQVIQFFYVQVDGLSEENLDTIATLDLFNGKTPDEILSLERQEIQQALMGVEGVSRQNIRTVTNEFIAFLEEYKTVTTPVAAPAPQEFVLKTEKTTATMSTNQLIELICTETTRYEEIIGFLQQKPDFARASQKARGRIGLRRGENPAVSEMIEFVAYLQQEGTAMPEMFKGDLYPMSLKQALGIETHWFKDPFTGETFAGLWSGTLDLSTLGNSYEALIWYGETQTGGRQALSDISALQRPILLKALLREEVPEMLENVVRLFNSAKSAGDQTAIKATRFAEGPTAKKSEGQFLVSDEALENFLNGMSEYPDIQNVFRSFPREDTRLIASKVMKVLLAGGDLTEEVWDDIVSSLPSELGIRLVQFIEKSAEKEKLNEWDYEALVKTYAKSNLRPVSASAGSTKSLSGILNGGNIGSGSNVRFQNVILVSDLNIGSGSNANGTVRLPIDVSISTGPGCSENITQQTITWEAIARELGLV